MPATFAADNASDISITLVASTAHGNRVGAGINAELVGEDATRAVAERRARHFECRARLDRRLDVWGCRQRMAHTSKVVQSLHGCLLSSGQGD